jgi:hypothetical protein
VKIDVQVILDARGHIVLAANNEHALADPSVGRHSQLVDVKIFNHSRNRLESIRRFVDDRAIVNGLGQRLGDESEQPAALPGVIGFS